MKVFISHQKNDSELARSVEQRLRTHRIDCYLDVTDPELYKKGEVLADTIRAKMASCSHLLAVLSSSTRNSQWVPWEVGVASEKELPLASFARYTSDVPEFLRHWPYLSTDYELDEFARSALASEVAFKRKALFESPSIARSSSTKEFYDDLRRRLGQ